jgi:hypothetical protein
VSSVHASGDGDEARQLLARVVGVEERADLWPVGHRDVLVVADDGHVEQGLEDPVLGREQAVHRRRRDVGQLADRLDGRRPVAPFEEQAARRLDDRGPRQARPRLVPPGAGRLSWRHKLRLALPF